jgi:uncharacterized protein YdaU (DUF1376 family)
VKLPFFQFYPADYQRDTRALSLAAKGGWVDVLCMLHGSSTRGSMTLPVVGWARVMGATVDQAEAIISELGSINVADVIRRENGDVTLESRRMKRETITREQTRLRVQRHRLKGAESEAEPARNGDCNADETDKKAETRRQKTEDRNNAPEGAASPPGDLADGGGLLPPILVFPCTGKRPTWELNESFLDELRRLYPTIDPLGECRLAHAKIQRGAVSKKTANGMTKFLFSWMDRASNGARPDGNGGMATANPKHRAGFA